MAQLKRANGFGTRYGRKIRYKLAKVFSTLKPRNECPYCMGKAVKRVAYGIWQCRKCDAQFTARAYTPVFDKNLKEEVTTEDLEAIMPKEKRSTKKSKKESELAETEASKDGNSGSDDFDSETEDSDEETDEVESDEDSEEDDSEEDEENKEE